MHKDKSIKIIVLLRRCDLFFFLLFTFLEKKVWAPFRRQATPLDFEKGQGMKLTIRYWAVMCK